MSNEGNQIRNFISSSSSETVFRFRLFNKLWFRFHQSKSYGSYGSVSGSPTLNLRQRNALFSTCLIPLGGQKGILLKSASQKVKLFSLWLKVIAQRQEFEWVLYTTSTACTQSMNVLDRAQHRQKDKNQRCLFHICCLGTGPESAPFLWISHRYRVTVKIPQHVLAFLSKRFLCNVSERGPRGHTTSSGIGFVSGSINIHSI